MEVIKDDLKCLLTFSINNLSIRFSEGPSKLYGTNENVRLERYSETVIGPYSDNGVCCVSPGSLGCTIIILKDKSSMTS